MSTDPTAPITNNTLRAMHGALAVLGNRRMATVAADLKVGRFLRAIVPVAEPLKAARQRVILDVLDGREIKDLSQIEQRRIEAEISDRQATLDAELVPDFVLPAARITKADLPKEMTGDHGWENASQIGALTADLGPLFEFGEE